jgi:hypothetical protein
VLGECQVDAELPAAAMAACSAACVAAAVGSPPGVRPARVWLSVPVPFQSVRNVLVETDGVSLKKAFTFHALYRPKARE